MPGVERTEFTTTDADVAREMMSAAYRDTRTRFFGSPQDVRLGHVRYDLGQVRIDQVHQTMTTEYAPGPRGCVQIVRVVDHTTTYEIAGDVRHHGPGAVFLAAQPDQALTARIDRARVETVGLDLSLVAEVTGQPPLDAVRRFQAGALPAARADLWNQAVAYATRTVSGPGVQAPLVLDAVRRLLAAAALTAFFGDVDVDVPQDRADATPLAVRLAVAHMEANPDRGLSVADVALAAHVSVRALQLAFRQHLGTTPMAHLRRVRVDRVHADLLAADPGRTTVTAITARWGFHAVGRFSADYRDLYGEYPRDTLRRR